MQVIVLLYKGISGNYSTIVVDVPTASKTTNFEFVDCKDANKNNYSVVKIGNQTWMAENLNTSKYLNGDDIINLTNSSDWSSLSIGAWCYYDNDANYATSYGKLYNWYAIADSRNIAPIGWHVATDDDWTQLTTYLGGVDIAGGSMKESSVNLWASPNTGANNSSGFTALPGGNRGNNNGTFAVVGSGTFWWTSTPQDNSYSYFRSSGYNSAGIGRSGSQKMNGLSVRCVLNSMPTLSTNTVSLVYASTTTCGGNITSDGGAAVTARGVCWSTSANPTIADSKTINGTGSGSFSSSMTGLSANTTYYVKAYATNSLGTAYGDQITFKTALTDPLTVTDIDGNVYHTVTIGTQTWMVENLRTTKYCNGDLIGTTSYLNQSITYDVSPKYQWVYNGQESNAPIYGRLYTWHTVTDSRGIAPAGWHVASDAEWSTLQNYMIANGYNYDKTTTDDKIVKALSSTTLWNTSTITGTAGSDLTQNNASGLTLVPAGYRGHDGYFYLLGIGTDIWTTTEYSTTNALIRTLGYNVSTFNSINSNKNYGFSVRCLKNTLPIISTVVPFSVLTTSATSGGNITSDGGAAVTARGICWSTSANPTIEDSKTINGAGSGSFSSSMTGLSANTTYYVRAYATNSLGTAYGAQMSLKTSDVSLLTVTDIDGNVYHTVTIGKQIWMLENLRTTRYNDGTSIPYVSDGTQWSNLSTPGYCWYNNDMTTYKNAYGAMYNWFAANNSKLAPTGWHIPAQAEMDTLAAYLGGYSVAASKLKETGTLHWISENADATNTSLFTALPGGYRSGSTGDCHNLGTFGVYWSTTDVIGNGGRLIMTNTSSAAGFAGDLKRNGFSVRCIKDI